MSKPIVMLLLVMLWSSAAIASDEEDRARLAIAQASTALKAAQNSDAATAASSAMRAAHDHLTAARGAWQREQWEVARRAAEKAEADSNLAAAQARQARATEATSEIEASIESLRQQLAQPEA